MCRFTLAESVGMYGLTNTMREWGATMDWQNQYHPERTVEWSDIAAAIHETVTMDEVISVYAPQLPIRNRRCPCPFHNGKEYNFSFTRYGYKCFVCGVSGDVVTFVKEVCELATRVDAMKRMNADLNLHLPIDANVSTEVSAEMARRRAEHERKEAEREAWKAAYANLWDEWIRLDRVKRTADPQSESYANAVKRIDYISYQIDCLKAEPR